LLAVSVVGSFLTLFDDGDTYNGWGGGSDGHFILFGPVLVPGLVLTALAVGSAVRSGGGRSPAMSFFVWWCVALAGGAYIAATELSLFLSLDAFFGRHQTRVGFWVSAVAGVLALACLAALWPRSTERADAVSPAEGASVP
jgi:hypothetical protein